MPYFDEQTLGNILKFIGGVAGLGGLWKFVQWLIKRYDERQKNRIAHKELGDLSEITGDNVGVVERVVNVYKQLAFDSVERTNRIQKDFDEYKIQNNIRIEALEKALTDCHKRSYDLQQENSDLKLQLKIA